MGESTGELGSCHPLSHGGLNVQGLPDVQLAGSASPLFQRFDFPICQACSSSCCGSANSHDLSGIKNCIEARPHEKGLDMTDHDVPGEKGVGYLEEESVGN